MRIKIENFILLLNIFVGIGIVFLNYEPTWHRIFGLNLILAFVGYAMIAIFIFTALRLLWQFRKSNLKAAIFLILYSAFLINIFFNPLNIESKKENIFLAKMVAHHDGEFFYRRIIFDNENNFHLIDGFNNYKKYHGEYYHSDDTIILISKKLPEDFRDTLFIQENRKSLRFSKERSVRNMEFMSFENPKDIRLDIAKRTTFEIK